MTFAPSRRTAGAVVVAAAILGYLNAVANGYVMDDRGIVVLNPLVTHIDGLWRAFANPYWPAGLGGQYRPLVIAGFSLDWWIAGGDPHFFHAINVLWHAAASLLVWMLAAELLAPAGAIAAGVLFALTPVHVEAVANVVGRSECMAAAFVLAALLAHRRGAWLAPLGFALALLSKENGIVFLGLAVANDLLLAGPARDAFRERRWLYAGYAGVIVAYAAALLIVFRGAPLSAPAHTFDGASLGDRLLTVAATIPQYARLLAIPFDLVADYQPGVLELTRSFSPMVALGLLLALLLAAAIFSAWRRAPVLAFSLLWIPIAIAPVSNVFFVTGVLLAERTLYLPSVGAMLALGWVFDKALERSPTAAWTAITLVGVAFAARTWTRTPVWHDPKTFAIDLVTEHPEAYRGHWVIGRVYGSMGRFADAEREYALARGIFPGDPVVWRESAELRIVAKDWPGAEGMLDRAIQIRPRDPSDRMRLAEVRMQAGDARGAAEAAREALALAPDSWEMQMEYADVMLVKGDTADAIAHADRAVALSAGAPPAVAVRARARGARP